MPCPSLLSSLVLLLAPRSAPSKASPLVQPPRSASRVRRRGGLKSGWGLKAEDDRERHKRQGEEEQGAGKMPGDEIRMVKAGQGSEGGRKGIGGDEGGGRDLGHDCKHADQSDHY